MSGFLVTATAGVLETAFAQLSRPTVWPDPASGFAYRLLQAVHLPQPDAFAQPLRPANPQLLRRAPELAAFGYVITSTDSKTQVDWAQAFDRLMGRDVFPSDRNSFIHNPLELIGIAFGVAESAAATDIQRDWLAGAIQRGFADRRFVEPTAQVAAACAERLVSATHKEVAAVNLPQSIETLPTGDLVLLTSLALLIPDRAAVDVVVAEQEIMNRVLSSATPARDAAEAAGLYVALKRGIDRLVLGSTADANPVEKVVALCRRFQLFVERLQHRQRNRTPYSVADEYDVQDLLHAILKLHFDDVRPEEWTPSYAGNSSRTDFLLPRERTIVEAKMTRSNLGQKEVTNELIVDVARYGKMPGVDNLVCFVYDPLRRCTNPTALEDDLARSEGRLRVAAVVCPRGT
jgi:hypothetical protein